MSEHELEPDENGEVIEPTDEADSPDADLEPADVDNADEPQAMSEADIEKAMKALDKESTRHANRISEIMGDDAQALEPCPLCIPNMTGFVFPDAIPDDQRAAVLAMLTGTTSGEYAEDPIAKTCDVCDGLGETTTGSKVLQHRTRGCPKCMGMGWVDHTAEATWQGAQALRNPPTPAAPAVPLYVAPPNGTPDADEWGRPRGHWLYGKDPRYLTEGERKGDLPQVQAV